MGVRARLAQRYQALDLRGKFTVALLAAALAIGALITVGAYLLARQQLGAHAAELLAARAALESREIELRLAGDVALAQSLADNTVTANALADSRGRETYLDPLLRSQSLGAPGAELEVVDYRGRVVASSRPGAAELGEHPVFRAMLAAERPSALVETGEGRAGELLLALPIRYRLTGNVEGGVVLRVPLGALLGRGDWADSRWLAAAAGESLAGTPPAREAVVVSAALALPAPLDALGLRLVVGRDRAVVFRSLDALLAVFLGIGVLVVGGVVLFARIGAHSITAPLHAIAGAAEAIVASGRPVGRLPAGRDDEFGRLATAFNTMVDRLRESYGELEALVAERTRDYEESQQEAERVSKLLREAVQSIAVGFTIYDDTDCLVMCNEAYRQLYATSRDLFVPGTSFAEIVREGAARGQYPEAGEDIEAWVAQRVAEHQAANGVPIEQRLDDGRWLLIIEHRTPSGYIVGNRIDITELKAAAEALRIRDLYQRATLDNLPFYFWLKDAEGRFLAVNRVFSEACGRPAPEAVVGLTDFDVWPAALAERYVADDRAVIESGTARAVEEPVAGGGWIETYKKPVIAASGRVIGTVGFARDISGRKRMEAALAESEERFELAVRGANDGIWDWNPQTGKAYFSARWKSMLGYDETEIGDDIGEWRRLVHPDDLERVQCAMDEHLAGGSPLYAAELRLRCRDGSYKWVLCRGRAKFDEAGRAVRMSGSHTDISERRAAEARLRDHAEQLAAIFALSPDGFVAFDANGLVRYASPAFQRMTGIDPARVAGLDEAAFSDLLAAVCTPQARFPGLAALRRAHALPRAGRRGYRHLIEMAGAGQRVLQVGVRVAQGESIAQILYLRDVTHETEVDRMKSEFLSTAAHELRTPMASIYGYSELMLAQSFTPAEQAEFLAIIHRQAGLMIAIINELLDLARIEARRGKDFVFERIEARALLAAIVADFQVPDGRQPPRLPPGQGACWVRADGRKLRQAICNVLSNAYKYSPDGGGVELELIATPVAEEPARLGIQVTDHGIGMRPEVLARVCERFYRADASGKIPGTGLGLSIVQEIIELHGGRLEFASRPGAGTRVTIWLPVC